MSLYTSDCDEHGVRRKLVRDEPASLNEPTSSLSRNTVFLKFAVLGDAGVGKTSMLVRIKDQKFSSTVATISVDYFEVWIRTNHPKYDRPTKITMVDTAGQEKFAYMIPTMIRDVKLFFLVFDTTKESSFDAIKTRWNDVVDDTNPRAIKILVGTKVDLYENLTEQEKWMAKRNLVGESKLLGCSSVHMVSSKTGRHVNAMLVEVADAAASREEAILQGNLQKTTSSIRVERQKSNFKTSCDC